MSHKSNRLLVSLILALVISFSGITPVVAAGECYVKWNAGGANNGLSWTNAYTDLQSALGNAACTEIWVAVGTYKPGVTRTETFTLKNGVSIYGGFAGTETLRTQRNPAVNVTILSGDIDGNDSQTPIITDLTTVTGNTTNSYHVVNGSGTNNTAMLDGFTITAGNANSTNPDNCGGGMYNNSSSPTLMNLTFSGNTGGYCGGGMYNNSGNPNLANVTFSSNSASTNGGGMYSGIGSPSLTNVTFSGNSATDGGGGMYNYGGNPSLTNVTFSGNFATSATSGGGGISNLFSSPTLTNVTISGNSAGNNGGGMYNKSSDTTFTKLKNVIIWGNTAPYGSEITNFYSTSSTLTITYSVIKGGYTGTGNVSSDPLLGALANNGGYTQTMALGAGSSAIDKGTNTDCPATDQRGVTRPQGSQCDIGAYEFENTNHSPTDISLSSSNVDENQPIGTMAGTFSTTDPDVGDSHTYSFCGGMDDASFSIAGSTLKTAAVFDHETKISYSVCIRSIDSGSLSTTKTFVISVNNLNDVQIFGDVATSHWAWQYIERLYNSGITGGCSSSPLNYCPEDEVTRAQMAVFLEKGVHYPSTYTAPNVTPTFSDTVNHWAEDWIEALKSGGITSGCGVGLYCPDDPVTRAQMAVFLLKSKHGVSYTPPPATGVFTDVPVGYWADKWIEQLAVEGITGGCAAGLYCPDDPVTRAQMAVFLVKTFSLP